MTFARWEEGLVVAAGNPKGIRKVEDLARKNVRFVNREPGSGSRALLDKLWRRPGSAAQNVQGYDRIAYGHLAAAYCVVSREADVCLATRSAAQTFGLDFIPLHSERYDLVMRKRPANCRRSRRSWTYCSGHTAPQTGGAGRIRYLGDRRGSGVTG